MVKFKNNIEFVNADLLIPTLGNPNYVPQTIYQNIVDDIKQNGFYGAILINKNNEIVDGEHRWRALKSLGVKKVPVIVDEELNKDTSRIQTIRLNRERGYLTPVETGKMLTELSTSIPMDILSQTTSIPLPELNLLTNLKYDPALEKESDNQQMSWSEVEKMISVLTGKIKETKQKFDKIYTVGRGGLIPARLLADRLGIKEIVVDEILPEGSLFVDDILDSGKTFRKYGKKVLYAVLYLRLGYECPKNVLYAQLTPDDNYIDFVWEKTESKK